MVHKVRREEDGEQLRRKPGRHSAFSEEQVKTMKEEMHYENIVCKSKSDLELKYYINQQRAKIKANRNENIIGIPDLCDKTLKKYSG